MEYFETCMKNDTSQILHLTSYILHFYLICPSKSRIKSYNILAADVAAAPSLGTGFGFKAPLTAFGAGNEENV